MRSELVDTVSRYRGTRRMRGLVSILIVLAAVAGLGSWNRFSAVTVHAAPPGMATLTGQVAAPSAFTAAQVYLRNTDKKILHMVYTQGGRFRATPLFPGTYEVRVITKGLVSDMQRVTLKAGDTQTMSIQLKPGAARPPVGATPSGDSEADTNLASAAAEEAGYEEIYPAGPGRAVAERTCLVCHGENFLPSRPASRASWESRIGHMMGAMLGTQPASSYAQGLLTYRSGEFGFSREDRDALLEYMVEHFGPRAKPRRVRITQEMPVDEAQLGRAMYIEYYLNEDPPNQGTKDPAFLNLKGSFCCGRRVGQDVRFDDGGNVWLTDRGYPHRLVRLDPRTGDQKDFWLPDGSRLGVHEIVVDRNGIAWAPEHSGTDSSSHKRLLGLNPKTGQWDFKIPLDPDNVIRMPIKWTQSLAIDSKSNIYVGWIMGGALSQVDATTRKVTVFPIPEHNAIPYGLVADRNDNIFIALWNSGDIAKFDTHNHQWTLFTPPTHPNQTRRLSVDMQNNIWWGIYSAGKRQGKLAKLDQTTGIITEVTIPRQNAQPYDVETDADGNIWAADGGGSVAALWRFDQKTQRFTLYPKPQEAADSPKIQVTKDGAVWYSPRGSVNAPAIGVLFPDMDKVTTLGAFYPNGTPGNWFKAAPHRSN